MRVIFRAPIVVQVGSPLAAALTILARRTITASLLSFFVWLAAIFPIGDVRVFAPLLRRMARVAEIPIALLGRHLPEPFHYQPVVETGNIWPGSYSTTVVTGIAVYLALFYLAARAPRTIARTLHRIRHGSSDASPVLHGDLGGNAAELQLDTDLVRPIVRSSITQQVTRSMPVRLTDLTECRIGLATRWTWPFVPAVMTAILVISPDFPMDCWTLPATYAIPCATVAAYFLSVLVPITVVWIATPKARYGLRVSAFSSRRAKRFVGRILHSRPDLTDTAA